MKVLITSFPFSAVGSITEEVTVAAQVSAVQTASSEKGALVETAQLSNVALKGRDKEAFTPPPDSPRNAAAKVDTPDFRPGDGESH